MSGFILSGKHGKVRESEVMENSWKIQGNKQKSSIISFFWKMTNFNTNFNAASNEVDAIDIELKKQKMN
jgi:hypothetical protein